MLTIVRVNYIFIQLLVVLLKFIGTFEVSFMSFGLVHLNYHHSAQFHRQFSPLAFFVYKYKTSAFVTKGFWWI